MAHGCCYAWDPLVIWLHVLSDGLIALAYYSIPITLLYFVRKRKDLVFDWMFVCFAAFIVLCGTTHLMEIFNIWHPTYRLAGILKAVTALISVATALLLIRLIPQALALPSPAQLRISNEALQKEIRERKLAASQVESLNQELVLQAATVEAANKELETFAYSVSHDLRAPLRHIDGYVGLLREKAKRRSQEEERYMKKISDSATQMGRLIDDLLSFSHMGRWSLQPIWIETAELVAEVCEELAPDLAGRIVEWQIGELPRVRADRTLYKQIWVNLLDNSIKYTQNRSPGKISIGCTERPDEFEFYVEDNGAGFDMKYADKLFGVFQRLHGKEEFAGTGIGLANVQRIVLRHGGRIWAEGQVNLGATFHFTLPRGVTTPG